jgi:hypothetical protein
MQDGKQPPSLTVRDSQRNGPAFESGQIADYLLVPARPVAAATAHRSASSAPPPVLGSSVRISGLHRTKRCVRRGRG